ncbi:MAG: filamentous hemagglutinin N-terminal domain-containing protein, partial [Rhodospirillales bacterium]|nr:filamentous hemagglutinin N-terminal domain-containing protein [Rhodospirillales bacterium]
MTMMERNERHRQGKPAPKPWRGAPVRLAGMLRRPRAALLIGTALQATTMLVLALPARAQLAPNARPTGGVVVGGSAAIATTPNATNITQSTQRAAIDWQSFNVGSAQSVNFRQPNATAVTLNRVTGPNPSEIAGHITANGQVILENQDGIVFDRGAQVNTAGFVATAAGITTGNFMAGNMIFDQAAHPGAAVVNRGHITVHDAGIAALVAPQVANSGVIVARLGRVVLGGATRFALDLYGDGLVSIDVTGAVRQVAVGPHGATVPALVTNTGTILAAGGQIELTAREAAGLVQALVSAGGKISAPSLGARTGQLVLGGIGGSIVVSGALLAQGNAAGTTGGAIAVAPSGGDVRIAAGARIDASGAAGGGVVAIGTGLARARGGPGVKPAVLSRNVDIAPGATIAANATVKGHGGRVTVLAGNETVMDGAIAAHGGPLGGDGGFVEVSGDRLSLGGPIDVGAAHGGLGTILFDPGTLDIVSGTISSGSLDGSLGTITFGSGTIYDTVSNTAINAFGATADVVLQASTLLDVQASVSIAHNLTMQSGGNLLVDGGVSVQAGGTLLLGAGIDATTGAASHAGGITLAGTAGTTALLSAGTIVLQGGTLGGIALNGATLSAATVDLSTGGGGVSQGNTGGVLAGMLQSSGSIVGGISLISNGNSFGTIGAISVTGGNLVVAADAGDLLTVDGPLIAPAIGITAGGIKVAGSVTPTSQVLLHAISNKTGTGIALVGATLGATGVLVGLQANVIAVTGSNVIAGTLEVAPNSGSITVKNSDPLSLTTLLGEGEKMLRIGAVTPLGGGAPAITASSIDFQNAFGSSGVNLDLETTGAITGSANVTAPTLSGSGTMVTLGAVNAGTIGDFSVPSGTLLIAEVPGTLLTIAGSINAGAVGVTASTLAVSGTIDTGTSGQVQLLSAGTSKSGTGALGINDGAVITGGTIALGGSGVAGVQIGSAVVTAGTLLELAGTGITEAATGTIVAPTLASAVISVAKPAFTSGAVSPGAVSGPVVLPGVNTIAAIGGFTVSGGDFTLADPGAATLSIPGSVSANDVNISTVGAGGITINGGTIALNAGGTLVALNAGSGGIALTGGAVNAGANGTVSLASAGGATEDAASAITAATLISAGTITGGVTLGGANAIGTLGAFTVAAGDFSLSEAPGGTLVEAGPVTVDSGRHVGFAADTLTLTGLVNTGTGGFGWMPATTNGALSVTPSTVSTGSVVANELDFGRTIPGGTLMTGDITIAASLAFPGSATLGLFTTGRIVETGGTIAVGTLVGAARLATLDGSNTIATLGSFAAGTLDFSDTGGVAVTGPVTGTLIAINAGAAGLPLPANGVIDAPGGTVALSTAGGGVSGAGTIISGTLISGTLISGTIVSGPGVIGTVALSGPNDVGTIGNFAVTSGDFALTDAASKTLGLGGTLLANNVTLGAGTIALNGGAVLLNTGGSLIALQSGAGGIAIGASLNAGASGTVALGGTGGASETGTIVAGTLISLPTLGATANLIGSNTIAVLGGFTVANGDLILNDAGAATLAVPGRVVANNVTLGGAAALAINSGTVALNPGGTSLALNAGTGGIALNGTASLAAGAGTVTLGSAGGISQSGSAAIDSALLASAGSIAGTAALTGANTIATLGNFQAGTLDFNDTGGVAVTGPVTGTLIAINAGSAGISLPASGIIDAPGGTVALSTTGGGVSGAGTIVS